MMNFRLLIAVFLIEILINLLHYITRHFSQRIYENIDLEKQALLIKMKYLLRPSGAIAKREIIQSASTGIKATTLRNYKPWINLEMKRPRHFENAM